MTLHNFAWGLQSEFGLDVVWKPDCSGSELRNFVFRLKSVEEIYHSPPMGFGGVNTIRLPTWKIPIYFLIICKKYGHSELYIRITTPSPYQIIPYLRTQPYNTHANTFAHQPNITFGYIPAALLLPVLHLAPHILAIP
jgi:hypothetical protein